MTLLPIVKICLLSTLSQSVECKLFHPEDILAKDKYECVELVNAFIKRMRPTLPAPHSISFTCQDKSLEI